MAAFCRAMISANEPFLGGFLGTVVVGVAADGDWGFAGAVGLASVLADEGLAVSGRAFVTGFAIGLADSRVLGFFSPS